MARKRVTKAETEPEEGGEVEKLPQPKPLHWLISVEHMGRDCWVIEYPGSLFPGFILVDFTTERSCAMKYDEERAMCIARGIGVMYCPTMVPVFPPAK